MKKWSLVAALLVLATIAALPAAAGGSKTSGVTGWIALDGAQTALAPTGDGDASGMRYGGNAHFASGVSGRLAQGSMVYVTVVCTQGSDVVYQWSADPGFTFPLVDQTGQGLEWDGSAADCTGTLVYRVENGKNISISYLDTQPFHVDAAA